MSKEKPYTVRQQKFGGIPRYYIDGPTEVEGFWEVLMDVQAECDNLNAAFSEEVLAHDLYRAGKVMRDALSEELGALVEGDVEIGPEKYVDEEAARAIMNAMAAWDEVLFAMPSDTLRLLNHGTPQNNPPLAAKAEPRDHPQEGEGKGPSTDQIMEVVNNWLADTGDDIGLSSAERDLRTRLESLQPKKP